MPELSIPYIRFGRRISEQSGGEDYYTILSCSPGIPESAVELFRDHVAKSIQWDSAGHEEKYADCFLLWRVTQNSYWFAQVSDAGRDSRNRPHAVQMSALFLDESFLANLPENLTSFLAFLCRNSTWQERLYGATCDFFYEPEHENNVVSLENKIDTFFNSSDSNVQSLFIAAHPNFIVRGIDIIVYLNDDSKIKIPTSSTHDQPPKEPPAPPLWNGQMQNIENMEVPQYHDPDFYVPKKTSVRSIIWKVFLFLLFMLLFIGVIVLAGLAFLAYEDRTALAEQLEKMVRKHDQEVQHLKDQIEAQKEEMKAKDRELEKEQRKSKGITRQLDDLQKQLEQSRKNANHELREKFDESQKRYEDFYTDVQQQLQQLLQKWNPKPESE